jgi:hypothetical protein
MFSTRLFWKSIVSLLFAVLFALLPAPADAAGSEAEVACTTNTQDREVLQKDSDQRERTSANRAAARMRLAALPPCDVLVYGATPGGIAAAVAAGRSGRSVVLAAFDDHIGGIVSNGLTNADIGKRQAVGGLFYEFTRRVVSYYGEFDRDNADPVFSPVPWGSPFDPHGCHKYDPRHLGVREGYFFVRHAPFQIPYGVLTPRGIDGLLVPVACSCSHVAYNALRMEPVFMALGEASGIAAHLAIREDISVRDVAPAALQRLLVERGGVITFYHDLPFDSPHFAALQWLGARGLNPGYEATPELKMTRWHGWVKLGRILDAESKTWNAPQDDPQSVLRGRDVCQWLRQAGYEVPDTAEIDALRDQPLVLSDFAELVYQTIAPR